MTDFDSTRRSGAPYDKGSVGKAAAAAVAAAGIIPGTTLALGTGSTVEAALHLLANVPGLVATPTSDAIAKQARTAGVTLVPVRAEYDLYLDGVDQLAPSGDALKGSWGAHVREKTLAELSRRRVVICDDSKLVDVIDGEIPVAVLPYVQPLFAEHRLLKVDENGLAVHLVTAGPLTDPVGWDCEMRARPGVHSTGIFAAQLFDEIVIGHADGSHTVRTPLAVGR